MKESIFRPNTIASEIWPEYMTEPDYEDSLSEDGRRQIASIIAESFYFVCGVQNFENKQESWNKLNALFDDWEKLGYPCYSDVESALRCMHWIVDVSSHYSCKIAKILTTTSWDKEKYGTLRSSCDWITLRRARYIDAFAVYKKATGFITKEEAAELRDQIFRQFGYEYMIDVLIYYTKDYPRLKAGNRTLIYCKEVVEFTYMLWLLHEALVCIDAVLNYESERVSAAIWGFDGLSDMFYDMPDINAPDIFRGFGLIQESEIIYAECNSNRQHSKFPPEKETNQGTSIGKLKLN